jgi:hypothetical protein
MLLEISYNCSPGGLEKGKPGSPDLIPVSLANGSRTLDRRPYLSIIIFLLWTKFPALRR